MKRDGWSGSMQVKIFSISLHLLFYQCLCFFMAVSAYSGEFGQQSAAKAATVPA